MQYNQQSQNVQQGQGTQYNPETLSGLMGMLHPLARVVLFGSMGYDMLQEQYRRQQQIREQQELQRRAMEEQARQNELMRQQQFIYGLTEPNMYF